MLRVEFYDTQLAMGDAREKQLEWLNQVLEKTGLTANALAGKIKISASTLSRFRKGEGPRTLRRSTVNRIAQFAQMPPPHFDGLAEGDARAFDISDLPDMTPPDGGGPMAAILVSSNAMEGAGILPDDILVFDTKAEPKSGDIVVAQLYDLRVGAADTLVRFYEPPYLVAASSEAELRRPLVFDGQRVQVMGVVVRLLRIREFRHVA